MPQQQSQSSFMPDEDLAYTILSDLKRVTREYSTAATESVCTQTRQMFTNLLTNTLQMQGELFNTMNQQQMYNTASPVLRQEIDKQFKQYQQTQQQTQQFVTECQNRAQTSFTPGMIGQSAGVQAQQQGLH